MQGVPSMSHSKNCIVSFIDDFFIVLEDQVSKERIFIPKDKFTIKPIIGEQLEVTRDEAINGYIFKSVTT